jgi:glycosyltransferase involved in cell wall biosynthesis
MFRFEPIPLNYQDPWNEPLSDRIAALSARPIRIAYYHERPDSSSFRYRVYNMVQAITLGSRSLSASYFTEDDVDCFAALAEVADVIVLCRAPYTAQLETLVARAKRLGKRVLFDVDDLIFDVALLPLFLDTIGGAAHPSSTLDHWFACASRLQATLSLCDGVLVTNDYLADCVRRIVNVPIRIIPNFINVQQVNLSRRIYARKWAAGFASAGGPTIGYFSGSPTHDRDFQLAAPAIRELMDELPELNLLAVGHLNLPAVLQDRADRIETRPLQDFLRLQNLIGSVEVNIIPLQNNAFTNAKSELKYFEAAAVGTITVASPTHVYQRAITDGVNGFLARSYEWKAKLRTALSQRDSYGKRARAACEHAIAQYSWSNQIAVIEQALLSDVSQVAGGASAERGGVGARMLAWNRNDRTARGMAPP